MTGKALIFSAPSGSGKTTIVSHLLKVFPQLKFSVSATTRAPRGTEQHGVDYFFLSRQEFEHRISEGDLIEYEEVYNGRFYGTLKSEVERIWSEGNHVVFDVDVVGGANLKEKFGDRALAMFIKVSSQEVLRQRLTGRATDTPQEVENRLAKASEEMEFESRFDVTVVNDTLETALEQAESWVKDFIS